MVAHLTESLQGTIHECVPVKRICFYSRKGWTPQATVLHKLMIDRRRRWTRFQRISDRERYLQARSHFRHCLAKGRRAAWRELCSSTSSANFWTLYKKATREQGSRNVEVLYFQQQIATTDLEKATMLSRVFFPLFHQQAHRLMMRSQISLGVPTDPQDYPSQSWSLQQSLSE